MNLIEKTINLTEEKAKVSFNGKEFVVDFDRIPISFDASVSLLLKTKEELNKTVFSSCGCTTPNLTKTDDGYILNIKYNNTSIGRFNKTVKVTSAKSRKRESIFKIKGETYGRN